MTTSDEGVLCMTCRYWSSRVAEKIGLEPLRALCLHPDGDQGMKRERDTCSLHAEGEPVDTNRHWPDGFV